MKKSNDFNAYTKLVIAFSDVAIAIASPFLAWVARDLFVGFQRIPSGFFFYSTVSAATTLLFLRLSGASRVAWSFFSVPDALDALFSVCFGITVAAIASFFFDRLETVPRSLVFIHAFIHILGYVGARFILKRYTQRYNPTRRRPTYALLIGCNQIAYVYVRAVESIAFGSLKIIAALTHDPSMVGHRIRGVNIVSVFENLENVIGQFKIRGIDIKRLVIAANETEISPKSLDLIFDVANRHKLVVSDIHLLFSEVAGPVGLDEDFDVDEIILRGPYWGIKRSIDVSAAILLLFMISPIFLLTAVLVWKDVGKPLVFWQERPGRHGMLFYVYKFRTMKDAVGFDGIPIPDHMRTSKIGLLLRKLRLDELPQIWNIFAGDMSFIGPRPLLFIDQPEEVSQRLAVRPGISGWAQVNGGKMVTAEEKRALDLWYISHASLMLDIKIIVLTLFVMVRGDVARPEAVKEAVDWLRKQEQSVALDSSEMNFL